MNKKSNVVYVFLFHPISTDLKHDWFHFLSIEIDEDKPSQHSLDQKFFTPLKRFFTPILPHTLSLFDFYKSYLLPQKYTSILNFNQISNVCKSFLPLFDFLKSFLPHIWIEIDLKVWRREKGEFILEKMIVCLDTDIWRRFLDLSCESDNVSDVFEKMVPLQVKIES